MRKLLILISALVITASSAFAHPPKDIIAKYDIATHMLTVKVIHQVKDPNDHYIKYMSITKENGKKLIAQDLYMQFNKEEQVLKVFIIDLKTSDKIKVDADCNKFGELKKTLQI